MNRQTKKSTRKGQSGSSFVEYAMAVIFIVIALIPVMVFLTYAASARANSSIGTVNNVSPCTDRLKALTTDASDVQRPEDACN